MCAVYFFRRRRRSRRSSSSLEKIHGQYSSRLVVLCGIIYGKDLLKSTIIVVEERTADTAHDSCRVKHELCFLRNKICASLVFAHADGSVEIFCAAGRQIKRTGFTSGIATFQSKIK